jgi:hypothetical protein
MADALNEFFDRAGSALNRNLPGNRAFGLSLDPTKDSKSQTWPHSLYDGKGVIRRGSDGKVVASTGYLEPFIKVYRKDANGNLNLEIITENQEKASTIGSAINPRTNSIPSNFSLPSSITNTPFATPLFSTDAEGNSSGLAGFTPPIYYKYKSDAWSSDYPERFIDLNGDYLSTTKDKFNSIKESYKKFKDPSYNFKTSVNSGERLDSTLQNKDSGVVFSQPSSENKLSLFNQGEIMSSLDNEDPVFFGFEIIIDVENSPLFNGELETFIDSIGESYEEVRSRKEIVAEFKKEFIRYFRMSSDIPEEGDIFRTYGGKKYYYVNKISGIQKLNEMNTPDKNSQFVKYETDNITLTFFEDTTLNLGTLYSLYKLIYWSRLRGKSIIPENLLRFDCKIIVSELRNFVRVRRTVSSGVGYEVLKDNLSRYVYNLYECQFFFTNPTHPDTIDMTTPATSTPSYDVSISYKYSNMTFERFSGSGDFSGNGSYKKLSNIYINPNLSRNPTASQSNAYLLSNVVNVKLENYPGSTTSSNMSMLFEDNANPFSDFNRESISGLKNRQKSQQSTRLKNLYGQIRFDVAENKPKSLFRQAGEKFLNNLKTAGLMEAQRQINTRFALLNRSLDRIRNSFGIGRMSDPTNVYDFGATYNRTFINDVRNSLRTFAGESLTALITGG